MLNYYRAVQETATQIANAIDGSVEALREKRIEQEAAMTDRMLGAIEHSLQGFKVKGIEWSAKTLTDRGRGSQEAQYGADFMGVLRIDLPDFKVAKGFLGQAKLVKKNASINLSELKAQCEKMLKLSSASYVFLYREDGVFVVPAIAVVASEMSPDKLYKRSAKRFFEDHLECFIGDRKISAASPQTLTDLSIGFQIDLALPTIETSFETEYPVRTGIELVARLAAKDSNIQ